MKWSFILVVLLSILCLPSPTPAANPDNGSNVLALFPERVDFYLGLPDLTAAYPKIRAMFVNGIGEKGEKQWSQLENMVTGALPMLSQQLGFDAKEALKELKGVHLVLPGSPRSGMVPDFVIAVEANSKGYLKKILEKWKGLFTKKSDYGGTTIHEFSKDEHGGHLLTFGAAVVNDVGLFGTIAAVRQAVDRGQGKPQVPSQVPSRGPSLADNVEIKKLLSTGKAAPLMISSVEFGKLWRMTKRSMSPYMRDDMELFDAVAGMSDIANVSYVNALEDLGTSIFSIAFTPESEIYPFIRQKGTETKTMLSMIPADAFATAVCSFDDIGATAKSTVRWIAVNEENWGLPAGEMERGLKNEFPREMGMTFDEFAGAFGNEVGAFWLMPEGGFKTMRHGPTGMVFIAEFKTPKDAERMVNLLSKINDRDKRTDEVYKGVSLLITNRERHEVPVICAIGRYGVMTLDDARDQGKGCIDAVKRMIDVVKGDAPSIAEAKEYRSLLAKLPAKNARTILVNWEELARAIDAMGEIPFVFERYCAGWREAAVLVDGEREMTLHSASNRPALTGVFLATLETTLTMLVGTMRVSISGSDQVALFDDRRKETPPPAFASDAEREARIDDLIRQLDDDDPVLRQKATDELVAIGEPVTKKVRAAFHAPASDEAKSRAKSILFELGTYDVDPDRVRRGIDKIIDYLSSEMVRCETDWDGDRPTLVDTSRWREQEPLPKPDFSLLRSSDGLKAFWAKAKESPESIRLKAAVVLSQCPTIDPIAGDVLERVDQAEGRERKALMSVLSGSRDAGVRKKITKGFLQQMSADDHLTRYDAMISLERMIDDVEGYNPFHNATRRAKAIERIEKRLAGDGKQ